MLHGQSSVHLREYIFACAPLQLEALLVILHVSVEASTLPRVDVRAEGRRPSPE